MNNDAKIILITVTILIMLGIVMIYSSSAVYSYIKYDDSAFFIKKQMLYLAVAISFMVLGMSLPVNGIKEHARGLLVFFILLLIAVLIPSIGREIGGARRWIRFFGFGFQPSEMVKLGLIIYLSDFISRKRWMLRDLRLGFLPPLFVIFLVSAIVLLEPDMGASVTIAFMGILMLFAAGAKKKHLVLSITPMLPIVYFLVKWEPYRLKRILTFANPWADSQGAGFQLIQSFIALGSGGIFGVGLGESRQKLFYLPEAHTDFVFSIIGEELGFLGALAVILLFLVLIWFSFRLSFKVQEKFRSNLVFGISLMIAIEVVVNIGVSLGILPTKGLPLPFLSYGGSSLVCHCLAVGLMLNVSREAD
ncbi:MAG: putative lipid II flippase FtsW [Candidatus Omnitrophota bacterium]